MDSATKAHLLLEYDRKLLVYGALSKYSQRLLEELLQVARIKVLSTATRVKTKDSLSEKLSRPGKRYDDLEQVTDLVGLRVVTFFEDEVDAVAALVDKEFELIPQYCVDRRSFAEPDRFGYRSLHYVCKLHQTRREHTETGGYCNELFEIQIRSMLQHAWAEIEHFGYKSEVGTPYAIRHRMSRVAGLLEIADREFVDLREESLAYREEVAAELQKNTPMNIELNSVSYLSFIETSPLIQDLDCFIVHDLHFSIDPAADADENFVVECLRSIDIGSLEQLQKSLHSNTPLLRALARIFLGSHLQGTEAVLAPAISVFHLCQIIALQQGGIERLREFYEQHQITGVGTPRESAQDTAATVARAEATLI